MNYLSFFSGALGLDLGLEQAGFTPLLACEIDKDCVATIKKNKPNLPVIGDIRDYSAQQIRNIAGLNEHEKIDLVVGGPPCQAFSTAGARKSFEDDRGNVFLKYLELAVELSPNYIVIENVRGLLSAALRHRPLNRRGKDYPPLESDEAPGGALAYIIKFLEMHNYRVNFNLYNAANFGAPQVRERVIVIASKNGSQVPYLEPTHSAQSHFDLPNWKSVKSSIFHFKDEDNIECAKLPLKIKNLIALLGPGEYWKQLPENLHKEALGGAYFSTGGRTGFCRRLPWDKPSPTLVTSPVMKSTLLAHPEKLRALSVTEYAALQQFPDTWQFQGKTASKYKQIGNAVPCGLGEAIGNILKKHALGVEIKKYTNFPYSRYKETSYQDWREKHKKLF